MGNECKIIGPGAICIEEQCPHFNRDNGMCNFNANWMKEQIINLNTSFKHLQERIDRLYRVINKDVELREILEEIRLDQ